MTIWLWAGFVAFIVLMLWLDLGVINRRAHRVGVREAITWTCVCVALALGFNVLVYFMYEHHWLGIGVRVGEDLGGREAAAQFLAGWIVEYSLSLDNIFIMALIFQYFRVPEGLQHRVLFWGILGALVMRGAMIAAGTALIRWFSWTEYLFGAVLLYSALRMFLAGHEKPDPEHGWIVTLARRLLRIGPSFEGDRFFTRINGRRAVTPLFLVLLVIETTDVVFAVDSIPAILGITHDAFLVFTSNIFAIMGLRSLYFALAAMIDKFRYLKVSLVFVLAFVGVKMLIGHWATIPTNASLVVIALILCAGLVPSAFASRLERLRRRSPVDDLALAADLAWRRARRVVILVLGMTIVFILAPLTGLLPGPGGIPVAIAGLALLATEFVWARKLLSGLKSQARNLQTRADALVGDRPRLWLVPPVLLVFAAAIGLLVAWKPGWWPMICLGASGPTMAVGYWSLAVFKRWRLARGSRDTSTARKSGGP